MIEASEILEVPDERIKRMKKEKNTYSQTSGLENPQELQLHYHHERSLNKSCFLLFCRSLNKSSQVNNHQYFVLNGAKSNSTVKVFFRNYGVAKTHPGFQVGWSDLHENSR
jgi:translation initiation factor 2 beta subunit (eIF-2beta)/eIF-5